MYPWRRAVSAHIKRSDSVLIWGRKRPEGHFSGEHLRCGKWIFGVRCSAARKQTPTLHSKPMPTVKPAG